MKRIKLTDEFFETIIEIEKEDKEKFLLIKQRDTDDGVVLSKSEAIVLLNALKESISG